MTEAQGAEVIRYLVTLVTAARVLVVLGCLVFGALVFRSYQAGRDE